MKWLKGSNTTSTSLIVHALIQSHPNFTYLPRERRTLCLTAGPPSWAGQTIRQSNAYLTSNLNSISLCRIHTTVDPNHPESALIWMCVRLRECAFIHLCEINTNLERREKNPSARWTDEKQEVNAHLLLIQ